MASSFNHLYGEHFVLPEAQIEESVATLPGLDGRKMSKSYDNTIPLFAPRDQLKKLIAGIKTDSRAPGEPKDTEGSALFQIYQAFATPAETAQLRQDFAAGISWADAKQKLFERIDTEIAPMRAAYEDLIAHPDKLETLLQAGAAKARQIATPLTAKVRQAVGLRDLRAQASDKKGDKKDKAALPSFKQYRESDGKFYFKLVDAQGKLLLQSEAYDSPKDAGQAVKRLQEETGPLASVLQGIPTKQLVTSQEIESALQTLLAAKD
jgi:tryptophanyl-tRNA synthetase